MSNPILTKYQTGLIFYLVPRWPIKSAKIRYRCTVPTQSVAIAHKENNLRLGTSLKLLSIFAPHRLITRAFRQYREKCLKAIDASIDELYN